MTFELGEPVFLAKEDFRDGMLGTINYVFDSGNMYEVRFCEDNRHCSSLYMSWELRHLRKESRLETEKRKFRIKCSRIINKITKIEPVEILGFFLILCVIGFFVYLYHIYIGDI